MATSDVGTTASTNPLIASASVGGVPAPALGFAMSTWLALTLAASHVLAPSLWWALGGALPSIATVWVHGHAFALVGLVAVTLVAQGGIPVRQLVAGQRDPALAAAFGGLAGWLAVQLVAPGADVLAMGLVALVESAMVGVLLSSFTRRAPAAFALGAAFELSVTGIVAAFLALL